MQPVEIMRATEEIAHLGAAFYFTPETVEVGKANGLGGFRFYFIGRGGVLGDVDADVVRSAFGYFNPDMVRKMWESSVAIMPPRDAARLYISCAHDFGRRKFASVDGLDVFVDAATTVIGAVEGASLPLFAGVRAEPVPDDTPAAAMHQAMVLRELRGSVHLLALTAMGLNSSVAHAVKRPDDLKMFGYEEAPALSDVDRTAWARAEALTDDILTPAYAALTDTQAQALIDGTNAMHAAMA
ncbi:MAG TPA: hypothetical protein VMM60_12855 [Ilumatobacter sp.]|nr:hypothetical protein [Ilumatobacter sp.]